MMINLKQLSKWVGFHGKILFKGFIRMLCGSATAALFAVGIYGLILIASGMGWEAVFAFLISIGNIFIALMTTYAMGGTGKKGAKR